MSGVRFERTPARTDQRRSFAITIGLRPGYGWVDNGAPEAAGDPDAVEAVVVAEHGRWMRMLIPADPPRPYLTGVFTRCAISYAWPRPDDGLDIPVAGVEPGLVFAGEVSVLYAAHVGDEEVVDLLDELAGVLAAAAGQQRVYVTYRDRAWVLDRHEQR